MVMRKQRRESMEGRQKDITEIPCRTSLAVHETETDSLCDLFFISKFTTTSLSVCVGVMHHLFLHWLEQMF